MQALLTGLEATPLAAALRGSVWLYPLVNATHLVGIALLFGAIAALDLRLIGAFRRHVPAAALAPVLVPVAATGLALATTAGTLLFICKATEYAASALFQAKLAVIALALANALAAWRWRLRRRDEPVPPAMRLSAAASLGLWLTAIVLGRLVGYF